MGAVEEIIEYVSKWRSSNTYITYSDGTLTEESLLGVTTEALAPVFRIAN